MQVWQIGNTLNAVEIKPVKNRQFENLPETTQEEIEKYRNMSFYEKMQIIDELNRAGESEAIKEARQQYPEASNLEIRFRAASRRIPADLLCKAFGWDAETGKFSMNEEQKRRVGIVEENLAYYGLAD